MFPYVKKKKKMKGEVLTKVHYINNNFNIVNVYKISFMIHSGSVKLKVAACHLNNNTESI